MLTSDCKHFLTGLDLSVAMELIKEDVVKLKFFIYL